MSHPRKVDIDDLAARIVEQLTLYGTPLAVSDLMDALGQRPRNDVYVRRALRRLVADGRVEETSVRRVADVRQTCPGRQAVIQNSYRVTVFSLKAPTPGGTATDGHDRKVRRRP